MSFSRNELRGVMPGPQRPWTGNEQVGLKRGLDTVTCVLGS